MFGICPVLVRYLFGYERTNTEHIPDKYRINTGQGLRQGFGKGRATVWVHLGYGLFWLQEDKSVPFTSRITSNMEKSGINIEKIDGGKKFWTNPRAF